jgi:hypothetical protein
MKPKALPTDGEAVPVAVLAKTLQLSSVTATQPRLPPHTSAFVVGEHRCVVRPQFANRRNADSLDSIYEFTVLRLLAIRRLDVSTETPEEIANFALRHVHRCSLDRFRARVIELDRE